MTTFRRHLRDAHDYGGHRANGRAGERHVRPVQQSTIPHANEVQRTSSGSPAKLESGLRKQLGSLFRKQHGRGQVISVTIRRYWASVNSRFEKNSFGHWALRRVSAFLLSAEGRPHHRAHVNSTTAGLLCSARTARDGDWAAELLFRWCCWFLAVFGFVTCNKRLRSLGIALEAL